jgi:Ca-activated chloride channel family protein
MTSSNIPKQSYSRSAIILLVIIVIGIGVIGYNTRTGDNTVALITPTIEQQQLEVGSPHESSAVMLNDGITKSSPAPQPVTLDHIASDEERSGAPAVQTLNERHHKILNEHPQLATAAIALPQQESIAPLRSQPLPVDQTTTFNAVNREHYAEQAINTVKRVSDEPVSTFAIDVDTASYANTRRLLNAGQMPPPDAVRIEEFINYFHYDYPPPPDQRVPFRIITEITTSPFHHQRHLLRIGLKGFELSSQDRPAANLVFLIDVSGSMNNPTKLPLLKRAFEALITQLRSDDRIGIVTYAGQAGVVLAPTNDVAAIRQAIAHLTPQGSTAGAAGIQTAYDLARSARIESGINRILLATDGDFNVGVIDPAQLQTMIETERESGIGLTILGFGSGNYNDALMERLSNAGDGHAYYIDTFREAQKVLVDELSSTLFTIAKDVKIQIEFNPARVAEYRLIGFENRLLAQEDFNNDRIDAGDIGAGHCVTAFYELALVGSGGTVVDASRYTAESSPSSTNEKIRTDELGYLKLRYKHPNEDQSQLLEQPVLYSSIIPFEQATPDHRFATAVAGFGQLLKDDRYLDKQFDFDTVLTLAQAARGHDEFGYRSEFLQLVRQAATLQKTVNDRQRLDAKGQGLQVLD